VTWTLLAAAALILAAGPALLFRANLRAYRPPPRPDPATPPPRISLLIPARNEAASIGPAVEAALASRGVDLEVLVLDDGSEDATAAVVTALAAGDARVRLLAGAPLPPGWCGKQHACAALAAASRYPLLAFVDADVRLAPDGLARLAAFLDASGADLVSGFPRQETGTLLEKLVLPLMNFLLLGFLPLGRMRRSPHPAYGAGCGQLFLTRRVAYERAGGHAAIRASLHDGLTLPRAFRAAGCRTDLCDATHLAVCRMYRTAGELWCGLAKNAREGLAAPGTLLPATALLLGGQVLPVVLLACGALLPPAALGLAVLGTAAAYYPRLAAAWRFRQSYVGAWLHPLGVLVLLAIQWYAAARAVLRRPSAWKGRHYPVGTAVAETNDQTQLSPG
jgi:hypothetical protein